MVFLQEILAFVVIRRAAAVAAVAVCNVARRAGIENAGVATSGGQWPLKACALAV
jgi:hypothetical protein